MLTGNETAVKRPSLCCVNRATIELHQYGKAPSELSKGLAYIDPLCICLPTYSYLYPYAYLSGATLLDFNAEPPISPTGSF